MSQQTQSRVYSAALSPTSDPDLSWSLWQPVSASALVSALGNRTVVLGLDPFEDTQEVVASMRGDPLLSSLGISSINVNSYGCFSPPPPLQHVKVTEYHNTILDHYFLSSSEAENALIDSGAAGPGWERTGQTFMAATVDPCYGMKKVFRFYSPAARSHFGATMPVNGTCTGYHETAVYRLYSNRAMYGDPNHRYTIYGDIYRQMIDKGWIGEGVAMCIREGS